MSELGLIQIYNEGRLKGMLPNSVELNEFVWDELINKTKYYDTWYSIYSTYSSVGMLEYCFQNNCNSFTWRQIEQLFKSDKSNRDVILKKLYGKFLTNKRSKR